MGETAPPLADIDLPTREDVQELRQAVESLRDHVQIVWQAIDEVREVIEQVVGHDAAEFWHVEPPQGLSLGRFRPFAGFDPAEEWQAEQEEAAVEPPPVHLTSDSEGEDAGESPAEVSSNGEATAAPDAAVSESHKRNGHDARIMPAATIRAQQRSLFLSR